MSIRLWNMPWLASLLCALCCACATDLRDEQAEASDAASPRLAVTNSDDEGGATRTVIDASHDETFTYFDFETSAQAMPDTAEDSTLWDLGFQRFKIKSNGGVSGSGEVAIAILADIDFVPLTVAPSEGYISDEPDGDDENTYPDYVMNSGETWFAYNPQDHSLKPRELAFVLRSVEGNYYKLQMLEYYDDAGTPGFPSFRWAAVDPPPR
jgi:hypothetical protein